MINDNLIDKVKNGDEEAFKEVIARSRGVAHIYIERYFLLYPKVLERTELYQLSLFSLYNSVMKYDVNRGASFSTFYSVIFERDILMHLRMVSTDKNKLNLNALSLDKKIAETDGLYLVDSIVSTNDEFDPKKQNDKHLFYDCIEKELNDFSNRDKDIFLMWSQGFTYKEIAQKHELNKKAVEYIIRKIKAHLRPSLKEWR